MDGFHQSVVFCNKSRCFDKAYFSNAHEAMTMRIPVAEVPTEQTVVPQDSHSSTIQCTAWDTSTYA